MEKKTIICPVDFTNVSSIALEYASIFTQKIAGDLVIIHVIDRSTSTAANATSSPYSTPGGYDKLINEKLETIRGDLERKDGISVRTRIEYGNLEDIIPIFANDKETALVVMGTSGAKGIKEVFSGTHTIKVLERTFCPVLVIPEEAEFTIPQYWVYATDVKNNNEADANKIWQLCSLFDAKLDLLHVEKERGKKEMELEETKTLQDKSGEAIITFNKVKHKDILEGINQYIGEKEPDILAVIQHEHKKWDWLFKEDKISKIVENANFPILVLREE